MRAKRDIGESVLLKLPIYYITINTCACIESLVLFLGASTHRNAIKCSFIGAERRDI